MFCQSSEYVDWEIYKLIQGWEYINEGNAEKLKWGWVSETIGSKLVFKISTMSGIPNSTIPNMALNIAMLHSYDKMWDYPFICIDPHILCISNHTSPIVRSTEMQGIRQHILHIWLHLQQPVSQFDLWRSPFANPASDCICLRASRMHRFHHSDGHCWPDRGAQGQGHWCCCLCSRSTRGSPSSRAS